MPKEKLEAMVEYKKLWVAIDVDDKPIGFVGCKEIGTILYVYEISVVSEHQKKGIGRELMKTILGFASSHKYKAVGLTT